MPNRICDRCGKSGDVRYGNHCEKDHFTCGRHDQGYYCSVCNSKYLSGAPDQFAEATFASWWDERAYFLPIHLTTQAAFDPSEIKLESHKPFLSQLLSKFTPNSERPISSRGATLDRMKRALGRAGYHPKPPEAHEHITWIDCSLQEDGSGPFSVVLFRDSENPDKYWGCSKIVKLKLKLSSAQLDQANYEHFGLCFHNRFDSTCIEASFLLEEASDEAIEFNLRYFLIAALNATGDILDARSSYSDERIAFLLKGINKAQLRRIKRIVAFPGPEGSPVRPRKVCETCGGSGYIKVNDQRQKCTACKGTGYNPSA